MTFRIAVVQSIEELMEAINIRKIVFVKEYGINEKDDFDNKDLLSKHVIIRYNDFPVATGRLTLTDNSAQIARIAVLKNYRQKGLGKNVIRRLEKLARECQRNEVFMYAHSYLEHYYKRLGYKREDVPPINVGRYELIKMSKSLPLL